MGALTFPVGEILVSPTRDQTLIPCIGRQILKHWTTREDPIIFLFERKDICHSKEEIAASLMYSF